jgi:lipopolysaccharide export LptBFGC system permease protein LptF
MGYQKISFWSFALALAIVSVPTLFLTDRNETWAWSYVGLILLGMVLLNWPGMSTFFAYLQDAMKG